MVQVDLAQETLDFGSLERELVVIGEVYVVSQGGESDEFQGLGLFLQG